MTLLDLPLGLKVLNQISTLLKKHYRLATRSLNPSPLTKLATKSAQEEAYLLKKTPNKKAYTQDFQQFLITHLLLLCKTAKFIKLPIEQKQVPKEQD